MILRFSLIVFIFLSIGLNAQNKTLSRKIQDKKELDTLSYLKSFEDRKTEFIGKPFSYLLEKMEKIQPKTVWIVPNFKDKSSVEKTLFRFYNENYPIMNETKMMITWEKSLPYKTVSFNNNRNKFYFSNTERKFYESKIVKDILIYR